MDRSPATALLRIGAWRVDPLAGQISRDGETVRVDARAMRLLMYLAERSGEVVGIDELLDQVWSGVVVTPDSVYQGVASLRRMLGDDARQPACIATVPRLGYRMVAAVGPWIDSEVDPVNAVASLAFLDLTEEMDQEYCGDAVTEDLIDKLSKIPGLRVTPPRSSFYFKGKQATVGEIAAALGVAYVLDGSFRESGSTLRLTARLIRADGEHIVWSQIYERPLDDLPMIHDDIASHVIEAMQSPQQYRFHFHLSRALRSSLSLAAP